MPPQKNAGNPAGPQKITCKHFVEICVYEVKPEKAEEFENLLERVAAHHRNFPGTVDARYMKRTHRQEDFASAIKGKPAIRLTRKPKSVIYALYWELTDANAHGMATKTGLEKFLKEFARCLAAPPKIMLGERIL